MKIFILSLFLVTKSFAFSWQDLWFTPDQQGQQSMQKHRYKKAMQQFMPGDWQAVAAYRHGDFEAAAKLTPKTPTELSYYNQGNALAQLGKYPQALEAYDHSLTLNPNNKDAVFNRKLVADLLKKQPQDTNKDHSQKDNLQKDGDSKDPQNTDSGSAANNAHKNRKPEANKPPPNPEKNPTKDGDHKKTGPKNTESNPRKNEKDQPGKADDKEPAAEKDANGTKTPQSNTDDEKQQAKEQWLRLIPDDPGGLLRQKFLRDYLHRQQ